MSRIGKMPIPLEGGVTVNPAGSHVEIKGPKGVLRVPIPAGIETRIEAETLTVHRRDDSKPQKSLHGLTRALLANAVAGVTRGFVRGLEIRGVGYRAEVKGKSLHLALGYSHPVEYAIPEGIEIKVDRNTQLEVSGFDKQLVGQVAAEIRGLRKPDVYKGKGIRYAGEWVRQKAGKTGAAAK